MRYDDADGAPIDEVAQLEPDLILATNSGITEAEYKKLSKIAPVVAYPEAPWTTPWQIASRWSARRSAAATLAAEVKTETDRPSSMTAKADYPELEGASLIYAYLTAADLSTIGIYAPKDPRVSILRDFGMVDAAAVAGAIKEGEFYGSVSAEHASELDSDVLITWVEKPEDVQTLADDKLLGEIPAIAVGQLVRRARQGERDGQRPTRRRCRSRYIVEFTLPKIVEAVRGS